MKCSQILAAINARVTQNFIVKMDQPYLHCKVQECDSPIASGPQVGSREKGIQMREVVMEYHHNNTNAVQKDHIDSYQPS